jgi:hypothetical protein
MTKPLIQRHGGVVVMAYATLGGSPLLVLAGLPAALDRALGGVDGAALGPAVLGLVRLGLSRLAGLGLGQRDSAAWRARRRCST